MHLSRSVLAIYVSGPRAPGPSVRTAARRDVRALRGGAGGGDPAGGGRGQALRVAALAAARGLHAAAARPLPQTQIQTPARAPAQVRQGQELRCISTT